MKRFARCSTFAIALAISLTPFFSVNAAEEQKAVAPGAEMQTKEQQAALQKMGALGENHKLLTYMVGNWNTKTVHISETGKASEPTDGKCETKAIMGGRFFQSDHESTMFGMPMEGIATTGYDNVGDKFVATWIDNFSTHIIYSTGSYDAPSKTFTYLSDMEDPMLKKGETVTMKQVIKIVDKDKHVMQFFMQKKENAPEFKFMEITYNRAD